MIGRIKPGRKVNLSIRTKEPEYKLGTRAVDRYGRSWRYMHGVNK
ncbi:hypothetical protein LCGC14_2035200 [marine sediment metagenome]|uniref:Uncharacterized protein n=1 Tax=marine sediment metagenome TaxID=412755 RepID=A0A0F9H6Z8_9ZZZZ